MPGGQPGPGPAPTIGVITALGKEFVAVKVLLENARDHFVPGKGAGRRYVLGEVPAANGGKHTVVLALLSDTGNNQAAARATLLLEHFPRVEEIVMTGIAGAVPNPAKAEEHVRLGDLIVSHRGGVIQYDFVKKERHRDGEGEWEEDTHRHPPAGAQRSPARGRQPPRRGRNRREPALGRTHRGGVSAAPHQPPR
jgi:nucleoside phosphorylase